MATLRNFNDMLNQFIGNDLMKEEVVKRDYMLVNCDKEDGWKGGELIVPFYGARASSIAYGSLTAESDIGQSKTVRGSISTQPEVWGSLVFDGRDLQEHNGKVPETTFLKILPDELEAFTQKLKESISLSFMSGPVFAKATVDGTVGGVLVVDRPERFEILEKVIIDDDNSVAITGYVSAINMETSAVSFVTARGGATPVDLSPYTVAQNAVCYHDGAQTGANQLTSLKSSLLSAANGGASTLYGQTKLAYPYLQAQNISGSAISASNILDKIFDAMTTVRRIGKGMPDRALMSYKHFGSVLKLIEASKGPFSKSSDVKASLYGWTEVEVVGAKGKIILVAINEMADDFIAIMDMKAVKIFSNGFIKKNTDPDGNVYTKIRATTGFKYIVDMCFFGDMVLLRPSHCGIIHSIPNY